MRVLIIGLGLLLSACASARAQAPLTAIEVVYHADTMYYTIEDSGRARVVGADNQRIFEFDVSHADFRRVADLLGPLEANGLPCSEPPDYATPGEIVFRRGEAEHQVVMQATCYADGERPLARNMDEVWRLMDEWGRARYVAPTIPEPNTIGVQYMYWGNITGGWSVSRSGQGSAMHEGETQTFAVSDEAFEQMREIFRPYEDRYFECNRVVADGPYGYVVWSSQEGREDQRTGFDAGCISGDANDLFERLGRAETLVESLKTAAQ